MAVSRPGRIVMRLRPDFDALSATRGPSSTKVGTR
jgi:hypothetical protein